MSDIAPIINTEEQTVTIAIPVDTIQTAQTQTAVIAEQPISQPSEINPVQVTTEPVILASNEAKPAEQPQIASEQIRTEEIKKRSSGAPCKFCSNTEAVMKTVDEFIAKSKDSTKQIVPFLEELCMQLDIDEDTMSNWANKRIKNENGEETDELEHPIFFGAYRKIRMIQKLRLQQRTMGRYNPTGAIFLLKANHGFIESEKRIIAGDGTEPLQITFTNAKFTDDEQQ